MLAASVFDLTTMVTDFGELREVHRGLAGRVAAADDARVARP